MSENIAGVIPLANFSHMERIFNSYHKAKLPHLRLSEEGSDGRTFLNNKGYGLEFSNLRPYEFGDNIKYINWRLTAKYNKPYQKVFDIISDRPVIIIVEVSNNMQFATQGTFKSIQAAYIAAQLAGIAHHQNDRVSVCCFGDIEKDFHYFEPSRDRKRVYLGLKNLCKKPLQHKGKNIKVNLTSLCKKLKPGALVFVICDIWSINDNSLATFNKISENRGLVLLPVFDKFDQELPDVPVIRLRNQVNDDYNLFLSKDMRVKYKLRWQEHIDRIKYIAKKLKSHYQAISTQDSVSKIAIRLIKLLNKELI